MDAHVFIASSWLQILYESVIFNLPISAAQRVKIEIVSKALLSPENIMDLSESIWRAVVTFTKTIHTMLRKEELQRIVINNRWAQFLTDPPPAR